MICVCLILCWFWVSCFMLCWLLLILWCVFVWWIRMLLMVWVICLRILFVCSSLNGIVILWCWVCWLIGLIFVVFLIVMCWINCVMSWVMWCLMVCCMIGLLFNMLRIVLCGVFRVVKVKFLLWRKWRLCVVRFLIRLWFKRIRYDCNCN